MPKMLKISKAAQKTPQRSAITVFATAATDQIRNETLDGVEYSVVPVIAIVEGVWMGASSDCYELALATEFGKVPEGWNGRPVTLGHPKRDGSFVSAGSPSVFERETVGTLYNTRLDGSKLKTEAWINKNKVAALSDEDKAIVDRLFNGQLVEVSTGLFTSVEDAVGVYSGQEFQGVWREVIPDHLALLPEGTLGACSVADGAGAPRINQKGKDMGLAQMRVFSKNPPENERPGLIKRILGKKLKERQNSDPQAENLAAVTMKRLLEFKGEFRGNALSNDDTETAIATALACIDDMNCYWLIAVFPNMFVYCVNWDPQFYQCGYSIGDDGTVTLGTTVTEVRPVTEFVPVTVVIQDDSNTGGTMSANEVAKKAKIDALIKKGAFMEGHRKILEGMTDEQLVDAEKVEAPKTNANAGNTVSTDDTSGVAKDTQTGDTQDDTDDGEDPVKPQTMEQYLAEAPEELREVLSESVQLQRSAKEKLIKGLMGHKHNSFSEQELKGMGVKQLEKLSKLGRAPNYAGNVGATPAALEGNQESVVAAPKVFESAEAVRAYRQPKAVA